MSMRVSMLKRSMRPRIRSLTRGWVTPRSWAASPCFSPRAAIAFWRFSIRSERTLRCSASPGEKPSSRNTSPLDRVSFTFFTEHLSLPARPLVEQHTQSMPGEITVILRCPPRSLFERVQDVDRLDKLRDVQHAVLGAGVNPDLLHALPHARHRLPIVRLQAALYPPQLEPGNLPSAVREAPDRFSGIPEPDQGLVGHGPIYKKLDATSTSRYRLTSACSRRPATATDTGR